VKKTGNGEWGQEGALIEESGRNYEAGSYLIFHIRYFICNSRNPVTNGYVIWNIEYGISNMNRDYTPEVLPRFIASYPHFQLPTPHSTVNL
jgi:hypothetical protein